MKVKKGMAYSPEVKSKRLPFSSDVETKGVFGFKEEKPVDEKKLIAFESNELKKETTLDETKFIVFTRETNRDEKGNFIGGNKNESIKEL